MVAELYRDIERNGSGTVLGHQYRDEELQRFRTRTSTSTTSCESSFKQDEYERITKPQLNRDEIKEEFSSTAAAAYQRSLIDAYRRKKQAN